MSARAARGDEEAYETTTARRGGDADSSRTRMDDGYGHQPMRQYDAPRGASYPSYQQEQWRDYDNNATRPARNEQRQRHSQYRQYDNAYPENYSKEQVGMQEVSHYPPPSQQYLNTPLPHGSYSSGSGGAGAQPSPHTAWTAAAALQSHQQRDNGTAYAPAPVATASMADLRDSITNSSTASDGGAARTRKPKRVYETAFGPFSWSDLLKRKYWKYYAILIGIGIAVLLAVIFHDDIIKWMEPVAEKIRDIPGGWSIWVGIMFVISFPPLFGHEVVCLLCGLIYGLWIGFAIISLGTMLGEWGNFFVFKYWCSARSAKQEEKDVTYACICRVIREGGFKIAFMARLSALPGHLTTPAFAACGMSFWIFSITAFLTLPKQLMAVYLGTVFGKDNDGEKITTSKIVEWVVLGVSFLITIWAAWYIYAKMAKWRPIVMEEQAANRLGAQEVVERDSMPPTATTYDQPAKGDMPVPRVTLSDEDGMIKSPSSRSNRLSGHRWPFHGQGHNRGSDAGSGGVASARRMEEGSLGDLDGANSPLVADSAAPAGYSPSRQHYQNSLYPASGASPYGSSEEDIGYGYADGGEGYTVPYSAKSQVYPSSSADLSMKWVPPQPREEVSVPQVQQQHVAEQRERMPAPPAQYNPRQYQQAYQTRSPSVPAQLPASYEQQPPAISPSYQSSVSPSSLARSRQAGDSFPTSYRQPDLEVQDVRSIPSHLPTPESAPRSLQASFFEHASPTEQLPQGALAYPEQRTRGHPQIDVRTREVQEQSAGSGYPAMVNCRGGHPVSQTQYHTGPSAQASNRYRSQPDPNRPSQYHTGPADPGAFYRSADSHTVPEPQSSQHRSPYANEETPVSADHPPRYQ